MIKDHSKRLTNKFGKKYTSSLLYKIKQFYNIIQKVPTLSGKLTWSHWYEMLSFDDINKIEYKETNPKYSIISVDKNNKFGHPNTETLNALKNSKILRTDKLGTIKITLNKNKSTIKTFEL